MYFRNNQKTNVEYIKIESEEPTMAEKNNANIGFGKQIWDAACVL